MKTYKWEKITGDAMRRERIFREAFVKWNLLHPGPLKMGYEVRNVGLHSSVNHMIIRNANGGHVPYRDEDDGGDMTDFVEAHNDALDLLGDGK